MRGDTSDQRMGAAIGMNSRASSIRRRRLRQERIALRGHLRLTSGVEQLVDCLVADRRPRRSGIGAETTRARSTARPGRSARKSAPFGRSSPARRSGRARPNRAAIRSKTDIAARGARKEDADCRFLDPFRTAGLPPPAEPGGDRRSALPNHAGCAGAGTPSSPGSSTVARGASPGTSSASTNASRSIAALSRRRTAGSTAAAGECRNQSEQPRRRDRNAGCCAAI